LAGNILLGHMKVLSVRFQAEFGQRH
jgi:hypothetical protein